MAYNIGPKIGIEGEAQFRQQIKAINNEYKTLQAETRALTAEFIKNGDQEKLLTMQGEQLEKQIDNQKYAIFKMKGALEEAIRTTGANSDAVMAWQRKIYDAQATVSTLEKELQDTENALQDLKVATQESDAALDAMAAEAAIFKELDNRVKPIINEFKTLQAQTKALTAEFDKNDDQQGKLRMQTQQLEKQIDAQKRAIQEMEKALQEAERTTGANSDAMTTWRGKLYNAQATVAELEKELKDTEDALQKMERGIEDTGDAADDAGKDVADFGEILKGNLAADVIWDGLKEGAEILMDVGKQAVEAAAELRAEGAQFQQTFGNMENAAISALENLEKKTGISSTRIKGNFSTVYAFAKTMGSESAEALDIASRAMVAAADSAAYYDKTVEEVTETIQAYIKGNYANDAALGIASTETTRNAAALERYGKAFKELSEAQKVDTLLAMVEAGNKASGAMGQAAREAGEWTNVTGELDDAWKQLMATLGDPILDEITTWARELTEILREMAEVTPGEQLKKDMEGFVRILEKSEQTYNSTMTTTLATASVAERYILDLQKLEQSGLKTAEAHAKYESIVGQLNAIMPQLNVTINEQTGLINQNTAALLGDVEAWKEAATTQAMYEKMKSQLEAYGQAEVALAEAQHKRTQAITAEEEALEALYRLTGERAAHVTMEFDRESGMNEIYLWNEDYSKLLKKVTTDAKKADDALTQAAKSASESRLHILELDEEIAAGNDILLEYDATMDELTAAMDDYKNQKDGLTEAERNQKKALAEVQAALLELKEGYEATKQSTRAILDSSIGLWSEIRKESDWTAKKVLQNWRDQMKAFDSYSANLKKAEQMGISEEIIKALSDGSQESMQILDAMVNQSEYSVGEINAAFTDLGLAKDNATEALMALDDTFRDAYEDLVAEAEKAGVEIVDGIAKAIEDNAYKVGDALADLPAMQNEAESLSSVSGNPMMQIWETAKAPQVSNQIHLEVTQLPGEDGEELAQRVADIIANEIRWQGGGLGG